MDFIGGQFPKLVRQYEAWYMRHGNAPEVYRKEITALVQRLREKYGLGSRPENASAKSWKSPQLQLSLPNGEHDAPNENRHAPYW